MRAVAAAPQRQIERQRQQRALGVVADYSVRRVLVGAIKLGPRVEAGRRQRLHMASGRPRDVADRLGNRLEPLFAVDDSAAQQYEVVVIGGETLESPQ